MTPPESKRRILFVCLGNICRSPMAEAMARELGGESVTAESAGVSAQDGEPPSPGSIIAARERGFDVAGHRARYVGDLDLGSYDWIVALTPGFATRLRKTFGVPNDVLVVFDIDDPYGGAPDEYRECASAIEAAVRELLDPLLFHRFGNERSAFTAVSSFGRSRCTTAQTISRLTPK